jgi:hypothetical protein
MERIEPDNPLCANLSATFAEMRLTRGAEARTR